MLLTALLMCPSLGAERASAAAVVAAVNVQNDIAIAADAQVDVDINPVSGDSFSSASTRITIETNNQTGYILSIQTEGETNTLTNTVATSNQVINPVQGTNVTADNFDDNTWGYNLNPYTAGNTFNAVPISPAELQKTDTASDGPDTWILTFGAKVAKNLPAGTYSNSVVVSAVANLTTVTWDTIEYMQDMTSNICGSVATPAASVTDVPQKQLIDSHDGKSYWVAKLADGNCWMTQNLALDITAEGLSSVDSDLGWTGSSYPPTTKYWNSSSSYAPLDTTILSPSSETSVWAKNGAAYTVTSSWHLTNTGTSSGNDYYLAKTDKTGCSSTTASACVSNGYLSTTMPAAGNHALIGNYYSWNAATAGTGGTITNTEATDSICPRGWKLPTSNNINSGSFGGLVGSQGVYSNTTVDTISEAPIYFLRSGFATPNNN